LFDWDDQGSRRNWRYRRAADCLRPTNEMLGRGGSRARRYKITLGDCHRQGRIMIEIGRVKCPRYGRYRLDKLLYMRRVGGGIVVGWQWRRACWSAFWLNPIRQQV
jgi:hypothetical protein